MQIARVAALALAATWLAWTLYRHLVVYVVRGRVLAVTAPILARVSALAGLVVALAAPSPAAWVAAGAGGALALVVRAAQVWIVIGASVDRVLERAALVLRGMSVPAEVGGGGLASVDGRLRVTAAVSVGTRAHLLRVRSARGIKKLDLFRANLRKFLLAIGRGEGR